MYLKNKDEYLISGLKIKRKPVDLTKLDDFDTIKKISDRTKKAKRDKENEVNHSQIYVYLPNFNNFDEDILIANNPPKKVYKYIHVDAKKIDTIEFPDYKKWYEDGNAVWKSNRHKDAYTHKFLKFNQSLSLRKIVEKRNDLPKYKIMLEEMNKLYTVVQNGNVYESTDFIKHFYDETWNGVKKLLELSRQDCEKIRASGFLQESDNKKNQFI